MARQTCPKTVLITGGANGLGAHLAKSYADLGCNVGILDKHPLEGSLLAELTSSNRIVFEEGDVSVPQSHTNAVNRILDRFGSIDTLICNAALWDFSVGLRELSVEQLGASFDEIFRVNVKGYILACRAAADALTDSAGSIILTLSNSALYPSGGGVLYTASKHAGVGIVKQLAYELAPRVRVNAVAPAAMATSLSGPESLQQSNRLVSDIVDVNEFARRVPLGFAPQPRDYVGAYHFLDSDDAKTMTGVVIPLELGMGVRGLRSVSGGGPEPEGRGKLPNDS